MDVSIRIILPPCGSESFNFNLCFSLPTDVQAEAIPLILGGGDVLMAAETGSGKTGAFCLPIMQIVWETLKDFESGKSQKVVTTQTCTFNYSM